ncbi:hypothetical protein [Chromohalobacter sp. 296-RDG]|uniref:hypothetical protein n=1 Tax=Chromohalobacter sp. 296-RDG TaxID=2994062 RepID=UPI0024698542|nr:hypothetical protein [Chromohalobacter sp. 296-RDG]
MDLEELEPIEGCSEELEGAMKCFRDNVTKSYTTNSRRWSIWSLLRNHFDKPIEQWLNNKGAEDFFQGESFSVFCKSKGPSEADLYISQRYKRYRGSIPTPDIDTLRNLLLFCHLTPPKSTSTFFYSKTLTSQYRKGGRTPFCELCWKESQAQKELDSGENFSLKSDRFCADHDPRDPYSLYRTDHNNRQAFYVNLRTITRTGYYYNIKDFEQRQHSRWVAYRMTKLHIRNKDISVMDFLLEGFSQSEIARRLGTSRQSILKIKKKTESFITFWKEIRTSSYPIDPEDLTVWESFDQAHPG